jgi:MFS family permease
MSTANTPGPTVMAGLSRPVHRRLVLAICCLSVCVTGIDLTIVNVALPSISEDLHASVSSLQWTVDAYSLVMACLLVGVAGALAASARQRLATAPVPESQGHPRPSRSAVRERKVQ